eukprot:scaffold5523_cov24-Cyclotella_meneghiniana.AAC.1
MPSRKKAQGKARKAKQGAAEAQSNPSSNGFSKRCDHLGERNWRDDDFDAAYSLYEEYIHKYNEIVRVGGEKLKYEVYRLANDVIYDKYYQLNDARKDLFRGVMVASGTQLCLDAAKKKDLTNETTVADTTMHLILINTIEVRGKYNGASKSNQNIGDIIGDEVLAALNDILYCPRQTIRFLHRHNSCDCLHEIYYKLKETTDKTGPCYNCKKVVEIRQLSRCEHCNVVQYCSYDCALAHWPQHKVDCEIRGYYKPTRTTKKETTSKASFCFNCYKVLEIKQLSRCEYCDRVQYCSYDCALANWPEHKVVCEQTDDLEEVD